MQIAAREANELRSNGMLAEMLADMFGKEMRTHI